MSKLMVLFLVCIACPAVQPGVRAQNAADSAATSFGLSGGFSWPLGGWSKSRIEPSTNLFGRGFAFEADLDLAIGRRWTLGIAGGYAGLDGSDWQEFVASKGSGLSVSAYEVHFAILLRPHVHLTRPNIVRIEFGPALLLASGTETYQGRIYQYDFLKKTALGVRGGIEYCRLVSEYIGVSLHAGIMVFPSGVEYVDGYTQNIISLPVTLGVRFLF